MRATGRTATLPLCGGALAERQCGHCHENHCVYGTETGGLPLRCYAPLLLAGALAREGPRTKCAPPAGVKPTIPGVVELRHRPSSPTGFHNNKVGLDYLAEPLRSLAFCSSRRCALIASCV